MAADLVLAIETSCDETAVAVARKDGEILVSEIASQISLHAPFGGVVPELASRNHSRDLPLLVQHAMDQAGAEWADLGAVAATAGPGLASSLLVGDSLAKGIALGRKISYFAINHLEGHLLSPFIGTGRAIIPHLALIVSGGHTLLVAVRAVGEYEVLGSTQDDAAGEAFDKVGKMLGLPYPGGPVLAELATTGRRDAYPFPRSMMHSGDFAFSFSGLKTSAQTILQKHREPLRDEALADFCASFEEAVVEVLVHKTLQAATTYHLPLITVSGGVSNNRHLRARMSMAAANQNRELLLAQSAHTTDNAAMIAFAAALRFSGGMPSSSLSGNIDPNLRLV